MISRRAKITKEITVGKKILIQCVQINSKFLKKICTSINNKHQFLLSLASLLKHKLPIKNKIPQHQLHYSCKCAHNTWRYHDNKVDKENVQWTYISYIKCMTYLIKALNIKVTFTWTESRNYCKQKDQALSFQRKIWRLKIQTENRQPYCFWWNNVVSKITKEILALHKSFNSVGCFTV